MKDLHESLRRNVRELCDRFPTRTGAISRHGGSIPKNSSGRSPARDTSPRSFPNIRRRRTRHHRGRAHSEEINRSGAEWGGRHAQMYIMGTLLRHGSDDQKETYLPPIARGDLRLQAFGVTEPTTGSDTTQLTTTAVRKGDRYPSTARGV